MTPQELKNSILQLAIQGKLVEQRAEEGTAEELYAEIQKEKAKLIKEGKIKKEKPLPEITEDEKPFDIPDSWKWVRLNEIATSSLGKTLNKTTDIGDLCQYLCSINVYWDGISLDTVKEARFTDDDKEKYRLEKGDLLICEGGDAGRCAIWNDDRTMYYQNALHRVRFYGAISVEYFRNIFELYKGNNTIKKHCKGETIQHLVQGELYTILFPLPPLAEQKRIVAKIEELLPLIDRYEQAWSKLEDFNKRFPTDMQKSILQMAIEGKLVEQRPEEGTGEDLYRKIQAEKQKLIKEGKIKKDKPLPEITDEEKPFDIPESWKWCYVGEVCVNIQYGTSSKSSLSGKVPVLRMGNIQYGKINYEKLVYTSDISEIEKYHLEYGDLLFNRTNSKELVGKTAIYKAEIPSIYAGYLVRVTPMIMSSDYLNYVMQSQYYWSYCQSVRSDAIGQSNINAEKLKAFMFPLPPFAEQKRIVAKLEELLPLCERLK